MLWAAGVAAVAFAAAVRTRRWALAKASSKVAANAAIRRTDGVLEGAEAITLPGSASRAALVLHGFNDTPQSVRELAVALNARGWTVRAPLLAHHGRSFDEFAARGSAAAWIGDTRAEWQALRKHHTHAVLVGQSMGGALAVILASEEQPDALVLLAPYLAMGRLPRLLSRSWPVWQLVVPRLFSNSERSYRDPSARARGPGAGIFTPRLVSELRRVVDAAARVLDRVAVPALVLHARGDYRIPPRSAVVGFSRLGSDDKTLVWRTDAGHVLAADAGREEVFTIVGDWLDARVPSAGA